MKNLILILMSILPLASAFSLYQTTFKRASFTLPQDFKFCVSTAAHQVEGNNIHSDWWQWEQIPRKIKNGDRSGIATDAFHHLDEDIQNMKSMGVKTYRYSIEWAKIEPEEGVFDEAALEQYRIMLAKLQAADIEPMITLYHFTLPQWVADKKGWEWDGIAKALERFTDKAIRSLNPGQQVKLWITLNEPMTIIAAGYLSDIFPPGKKDFHSFALPMVNMVKAHALMYHKIHSLLDSPTFKPRVGLAHHLRNFDPYHRHSFLDRYASKKFDQVFNWAIPEALKTGRLKFSAPFMDHANAEIPNAKGTQDFFGLNYYSRDRILVKPFSKEKIIRTTTPGAPLTDLPWEIYPDGLDRILTEIRSRYPQLSIWIAENGIADLEDKNRSQFVKDHLQVLAQQIKNGAPIEGYCHWTLNDNFEWAEGWTAHFGLFSLEPGSLKRIPRPSAQDFKTLIEQVKQGKMIQN